MSLRTCEACGHAKEHNEFRSVRMEGRGTRYEDRCRDCQYAAGDHIPPDSPWMVAERYIEQRYGVPPEVWLSDPSSPFSALHTALMHEMAGTAQETDLTVDDAERLCRFRAVVLYRDASLARRSVDFREQFTYTEITKGVAA